MQHINFQLLVLFHLAASATSFSAPSAPTTSAPWQTFIDSIFSPKTDMNNKSTTNLLKQKLLAECRQNIGRSTPEIRRSIESIMDELAPLNPTPRTAASPLLQKEWILEWTSEKEINFFLEKGISDEITQTLSSGDVLVNYIPFVKGGGFEVTGQIGVDEEREGLMRTAFKFKNANLDLGRWGEYNFPPIGEGWFDTIYLDKGLRIDTNSRNDILICRADN